MATTTDYDAPRGNIADLDEDLVLFHEEDLHRQLPARIRAFSIIL